MSIVPPGIVEEPGEELLIPLFNAPQFFWFVRPLRPMPASAP